MEAVHSYEGVLDALASLLPVLVAFLLGRANERAKPRRRAARRAKQRQRGA